MVENANGGDGDLIPALPPPTIYSVLTSLVLQILASFRVDFSVWVYFLVSRTLVGTVVAKYH